MTKPDDTPEPAPAWQSADDIPAWVPLRLLRSAVALAIGETAADGVTRAIMRAVARGAVASRYTADFAQWRQQARERGEELQDARTYAASAGGMLTASGTPLGNGWVLDEARGIVLAPGDPRCMKPLRDGVWPLGPVEVSWADVEALPAFRDAPARTAATPMSAPAGAAAGAPNRKGIGGRRTRAGILRAERKLLAWLDENGEPDTLAEIEREFQRLIQEEGETLSEQPTRARARKLRDEHRRRRQGGEGGN
jgi:hypothetical protein